jgi:hypothetical protein
VARVGALHNLLQHAGSRKSQEQKGNRDDRENAAANRRRKRADKREDSADGVAGAGAGTGEGSAEVVKPKKGRVNLSVKHDTIVENKKSSKILGSKISKADSRPKMESSSLSARVQLGPGSKGAGAGTRTGSTVSNSVTQKDNDHDIR